VIENNRPLVTFALFAYNQEKYIRDAVQSALEQDYSPLEIIISDDCSEDQTFEIIKETVKCYHGPHKIILNKNKNNLGVGAHVNLIMQISAGKFIVAAAGDDISFPYRVKKLIDKFEEDGSLAYSVWSSAKYINNLGAVLEEKFISAVKHNDVSIIKNINPVIGATHAWRREVFEFFGPLSPGIVFEDNAISFRSYLLGGIDYIDEELVKYRRHDSNLTNFSRNMSLRTTYNRAYCRGVAKGIGLVQRLKDLEKFGKEQKNINNTMIKNLNKEIKKNDTLIEIYQNFPKFKFKNIHLLFLNLEVIKVFIRCITYKIFGDKFIF